MKKKITHLDSRGYVSMVDVSGKEPSDRRAVAESFIKISKSVMKIIKDKGVKKGNIEAVVRIAAIQAAKKTYELIPLCHPLLLDKINVSVHREENGYRITVEVMNRGKTGVEMEAMTGASVGALAFYDMIKGLERGAEIVSIRLLEKEGGKSGSYRLNKLT